jgi:serine protease Do
MLSRSKFLQSLLAGFAIAVFFPSQEITVFAAASEVEKISKAITVRIEGTARGSGVIVERRGKTYTVLTNAHVLQHNGSYGIVTPDGECHSIALNTIKLIPKVDLAIFLFSSNNSYATAQLSDRQPLNLGETIYVGGWANSGEPVLQSRVFLTSQGQITEVDSQFPLGYSLSYTNLVRVGMSGGPILDKQGKLIGINGLIRLDANDAIVGSGIKIAQFQNLRSQIVKTIPIPAASSIACPRKYTN